MATIIHNTVRNGQLGNPNGTTTTVDFDGDDLRLALVDATDLTAPASPPSISWDDWADMDQGTLVADGTALASKTVGSVGVGVFDAGNYTFVTVTGDAADFLSLRKYDATDANSPLIITWDSVTTGLPVTPNGGNIEVQFSGSGILEI